MVAKAGSPTYVAESKAHKVYAIDKELKNDKTVGGLLAFDSANIPFKEIQDVTEEAAYIEEPKEEQPVVNTIVMEVIDRINSERVAAGAAPVVYDAVLNTMAQVRASENADNDYFVIENGKHKRPDGSNASSICSDYGQAGYFGEVMGRYQTSPAEIVDGWHNSATHYACMTSTKYNRVGVGIAADSEGYLYWVAIFMD